LGRPRVDDLKADLHPSKNVKFGIRRTLQFPVKACFGHKHPEIRYKLLDNDALFRHSCIIKNMA